MSEGPKIRSGMRGTPPGFFSGIAKTYGRLNLVTGSMIHFAARLGPWTLIPVGLTVYLLIDRQDWFRSVYERTLLHNSSVARVKYAQEEVVEEQSVARYLNSTLPRPLDLSAIQPLTKTLHNKTRQQRIIAENVAFMTQYLDIPPVGLMDARYKTYQLRHQELKDMEAEHQAVQGEFEKKTGSSDEDLNVYRRLLALADNYNMPTNAKDAFKYRTTVDIGVYQQEADANTYSRSRLLSPWLQSALFRWIPTGIPSINAPEQAAPAQ